MVVSWGWMGRMVGDILIPSFPPQLNPTLHLHHQTTDTRLLLANPSRIISKLPKDIKNEILCYFPLKTLHGWLLVREERECRLVMVRWSGYGEGGGGP